MTVFVEGAQVELKRGPLGVVVSADDPRFVGVVAAGTQGVIVGPHPSEGMEHWLLVRVPRRAVVATDDYLPEVNAAVDLLVPVTEDFLLRVVTS